MLYEVLGGLVAAPPSGVLAYGTARCWKSIRRREDNFATSCTVAKVLSERAIRKNGKITRRDLSRPATHPATAFGRSLGRTVRPEGGRQVWAGWEQVVALIAPPRSGKTAQLGNTLIDAPGAAVVTTTKLDLYDHTHLLRSVNGPVWTFNPENMGGIGSTFGWSPIQGCQDPAWALATAAYMVSGGSTEGVKDSDFWENQNAKVLRSLLFAAAVGGKTMADLTRWVTTPGDSTALRILEDRHDAPAGWIDELRQLVNTSADKTRESVYLTLQLLFAFMADADVAAAVTPAEDTPTFDLRAMVREGRSTLYLLGSDKPRGGVGPLFAALTGLIFEEAKRASQATRRGRLDPPLSLVLDEVANICPVPLPQWCADSGGRGISLTYTIQSPSQLEQRWGRTGKQIIEDATNLTVVFGGLKNNADLKALSDLLGQRDEKTPRPFHPKNHQHLHQIRRVPVMDLNEIRELDDFHALVIARNLKAVEIKVRPVWARRDVNRAHKRPHRFTPWTDTTANTPETQDQVALVEAADVGDSGGITDRPEPASGSVPSGWANARSSWTAAVTRFSPFDQTTTAAGSGTTPGDAADDGSDSTTLPDVIRRRDSQETGLAEVVQLYRTPTDDGEDA